MPEKEEKSGGGPNGSEGPSGGPPPPPLPPAASPPTVLAVVDAPMDAILLALHTRQLILLANILHALNETLQESIMEMMFLVHMREIAGTEDFCRIISKQIFTRLIELLDVFSVDVVQTAMTTSGQTDITFDELKALASQNGEHNNSPPQAEPSFQVITDTLRTASTLGETFSRAVLVVVHNSDVFLESLQEQQLAAAEDGTEDDLHLSTLQMTQLASNILTVDHFILSQLNPRLFGRPPLEQQALQ